MSELGEITLRPLARRWLSALSLGIVAAYAMFYVVFLSQSGPKDGDQFLVFHSLQYWNASMFGMAKQWTPLMCSGLSMAGEPQVPFMSLSMALSYMLGPLWGVKLAIAIYLLAGWAGAYLYAGLWLKLNAQRTLAAALFVGNGFFFCRLSYGHFDFIPFLILPMMLWVLHFGIEWSREAWTARKPVRLVLAALLMGAALALAIDGSPVAIIHLLFWIGLYALVLAVTARSATPVVFFACAVALAMVLDAGYLWPMLQAQGAFPRLTQDRFTSVFSLLWFALLPLRGKGCLQTQRPRTQRVDCPASRVREGAIELDFRDGTSDFAARISTTTWKSWLLATASMMLLWFAIGMRIHGRLRIWRRRQPESAFPQ